MAWLTTLKNNILNFNQKMEDCQETITFSQAGVQDDRDSRATATLTCAENQGRKLIVATRDSRFPDDMIDYALEMAKRMNYDVIAVNAACITHDVTEFFSRTHEDLYRDFKEASIENARIFKEKAEEIGLKFAHCTDFSNVDHAIEDITQKCGDIEFIITENREKAPLRDAAENTQRIAQRLCVYSVN